MHQASSESLDCALLNRTSEVFKPAPSYVSYAAGFTSSKDTSKTRDQEPPVRRGGHKNPSNRTGNSMEKVHHTVSYPQKGSYQRLFVVNKFFDMPLRSKNYFKDDVKQRAHLL